MLNRKALTLLFFISLFCSCSHSIHMVQASNFAPYTPLKKGKLIRAEAKQQSIMGFNRETNYVDEAYEKLQEQCKGGTIKGITTQYSTSHGFFHWYNKILMQGVCVSS